MPRKQISELIEYADHSSRSRKRKKSSLKHRKLCKKSKNAELQRFIIIIQSESKYSQRRNRFFFRQQTQQTDEVMRQAQLKTGCNTC